MDKGGNMKLLSSIATLGVTLLLATAATAAASTLTLTEYGEPLEAGSSIFGRSPGRNITYFEFGTSTTLEGFAICDRASFDGTLLSNAGSVDDLSVRTLQGQLHGRRCEVRQTPWTTSTSAVATPLGLPWNVAMGADETATWTDSSRLGFKLVLAGGPTCVYMAPTLSGRSQNDTEGNFFITSESTRMKSVSVGCPKQMRPQMVFGPLHGEFGAMVQGVVTP
jgi:hypothetical protein